MNAQSVTFTIAGPGWIDADNPEAVAIFELDPKLSDCAWADGMTVTITLLQEKCDGSHVRLATRVATIKSGWSYAKFVHGEIIDCDVVTFDLRAGTRYMVEARFDSRIAHSVSFAVMSGEPSQIRIDIETPVLRGVGQSTLATAVVEDAAGNPVADGTSITWSVEGMCVLDVVGGRRNTGITAGGKSTVRIQSIDSMGDCRIGVRAGRVSAETYINVPPTVVTLRLNDASGQPADLLNVANDEVLRLTAVVTNEKDNRASAGSPVLWWDQKGLISGDSITNNAGEAEARIDPRRFRWDNFVLGKNRIVAKVAGETGTAEVTLYSSAGTAWIDIEEPILSGDSALDASRPITLADGSVVAVDFKARQRVRVKGLIQGERIRVTLENSDQTPDPHGGAIRHVRIGSTSDSTEAIADTGGTAAFDIESLGTQEGTHTLYVAIRVDLIDREGSSICGTRALHHRVALMPAEHIVQLKHALRQFWNNVNGAIAVSDDAVREMAGDVALSFAPHVKDSYDVRDAIVNLLIFERCGNNPDTSGLLLAVTDVIAEAVR